MSASRTTKTLAALFAAMIGGAAILLMMSSEPLRAPSGAMTALAAAEPARQVVFTTDVPVQTDKWRSVVIHSTGGAHGWDILRHSHFVIHRSREGKIDLLPTEHWKQQAEVRHVTGPVARDFNADSISVCLVGDFSDSVPTRAEYSTLIELVRAIQQTCSIPPEQVYLHSHLDSRAGCPGIGVSGERLNSHLLRTDR